MASPVPARMAGRSAPEGRHSQPVRPPDTSPGVDDRDKPGHDADGEAYGVTALGATVAGAGSVGVAGGVAPGIAVTCSCENFQVSTWFFSD